MPFPDLRLHPGSGLSFPWAEYVSKGGSPSDMSTGHDGVSLGHCIIIQWDDLEIAVKELLGYSYRKTSTSGFAFTYTPHGGAAQTESTLNRVLPFRHPRFHQLWCTRITRVQNLKFTGKTLFAGGGGNFTPPIARHSFVLLTLQFTRPMYPIKADGELNTYKGGRQEWERYFDLHWQPSVQMLTRRGMQFRYIEGLPDSLTLLGNTVGGAKGRVVPGSVGMKIIKCKVKRTWYQIPFAAVFTSTGLPALFVEELTPNNFAQVGQGPMAITGVPAALGCVNEQSFLGCPPETLMLEGLEIRQQPLPMPPVLMGLVGETYPVQLDITFNFEYFNGPRGVDYGANPGPNTPPAALVSTRGHNCLPWSGDGRFYRVESDVNHEPPFKLRDFRDLFRIL